MTAAVLALASAAFACLQFQGKLTLSNGNGRGNTTEVVHSSGLWMGLCNQSGAATVSSTLNPPPANPPPANITVAVAPSTDPCTPSTHTTLPDGVYDVLVDRGDTSDACRGPNMNGGSQTGSVVVVVNGAGTAAPDPVSWNAAPGTWHVCVSTSLGAGLGYKGIGTYIESI